MRLWASLALCIPLAATFPQQGLPGLGLSKTFNAKQQRISTSGVHKFVPPDFERGDQRGPCPGLNALANHGYLPHSGVATTEQYIAACNQVFGMAIDVAGAFANFAAFIAGDGVTWSMGGPPDPAISQPLPGLLGKPKGITFSHNEYEGDASITRNDLYQTGDDYKVNIDYFKELYDVLPANSFEKLSSHRNTRVHDSIHGNPYFFNAPFAGFGVSAAANAFTFRFAANHSKEYPQGYLDKNTFATFWAVYGKGDKMYWKPGWDRIPENWYRRPLDDEYSLPFINQDLRTYITEHPETGKIGGNLGKVDTFTGIDIGNFTGGFYNAKNLVNGNNAACFAFQAGAFFAPDILSNIFADITGPVEAISKTFGDALAPLDCPQLKQLDKEALRRYPGYRRSQRKHRHT